MKARAELEIYNHLLSGKEYVFQNRYVSEASHVFGPLTLIEFDRLSSVDVIIAAHILLLVNPPLPDPLIKDLINNSYPTLASHAQRVYAQAFEERRSHIQFASPYSSLWALLPSWPKGPFHSRKSPNEEDVYYSRMSWGFVGLAIGSLTAYFVVVGSQARKVLKGDSPQEMPVLET